MLSQTLHSNFHANCFEIVVKKRILSSSNASKATYFAKVGKNIHSNLLVQTKLSWKHLICFHFSTAGCKNTSKTKMLLKRCLVFQLGCSGLKYKLLLWFHQLNSNVSAQKTMSSYMTSSVLSKSNQMPPNGLWCKENVNSSFDHVILHEMISSAQPYRSQWPTNSARAKWAYLYPITCACSALVWIPNIYTQSPLTSTCSRV